MNQGEPGSDQHDNSTPWDQERAGGAAHAASSLPDSQGDSEEKSPEAKPQASGQHAVTLTMGNSTESAGKGGTHALSSIHPLSGSKPPPSKPGRPRRKRGDRKPELRDVLTHAGLKADVALLRQTIAKGSHKERIEAFRLLYGSAADPKRGPAGPGPGARRAPGISLPDA